MDGTAVKLWKFWYCKIFFNRCW